MSPLEVFMFINKKDLRNEQMNLQEKRWMEIFCFSPGERNASLTKVNTSLLAAKKGEKCHLIKRCVNEIKLKQAEMYNNL